MACSTQSQNFTPIAPSCVEISSTIQKSKLNITTNATLCYAVWRDKKNYDSMLSRFHLIPERHGQTDRHNYYINVARHWHEIKTGPLRLIWHNFINSQRSLNIFSTDSDLIQFSIHWVNKFSNWLRNSCVVSIATVATWRSMSQNLDPMIFWHNLIKSSVI